MKRPQSAKFLQMFRTNVRDANASAARMRAALRRESQFENHPPSIRETLATFSTNARGAEARVRC
eukprot:4276774-Pyramimonas_sp.AAC.1